MQGIRNILLHF